MKTPRLGNDHKPVVVITGASGLIGTAILSLLTDTDEYGIVGIYNEHEPPVRLSGVRYLKADLSHEREWRGLKDLHTYALIHCAARIPGTSYGCDTGEARRINTRIDKLAVSLAGEQSARFIYFSSASVYGIITNTSCNEESEPNPVSEYAAGKLASENAILNDNKIPKHFVFRVSAPYDPHQRNTTVLKSFTVQALNGAPITYFGSGGRMQDFINVTDIARACVNALKNNKYGVYNITSGHSISMKDLAFLIRRLANSNSEVNPAAGEDPQESFRPLYNISKAGKLLKWEPVCSLEKGLSEFIEYVKSGKS